MARCCFATIRLAVLLALVAVQAQAQARNQETLTRLQRAAAFIAAHDLARAENELSAVLNNSPAEARALNLLGVVRAQQGRTADAELLFRQALASQPQLAGAHVNLGLLFQAQQQHEAAAAAFEAALKIDATRRDALTGLVYSLRQAAAAALQTGEREKALSLLIRAKAAAPGDADVLFEFGMTALSLALDEDAAQALAIANEKRPDEPKFIYALARARLALSALPEAVELFRRYTALRPQDATGHYGLGYALALLRRNDEAAAAFKRSLELRPEQTESPWQLGLLADAAGNIDEAAAWFERVLARAPDHTGALLGAGLVHFKRKQYDQARSVLERVIALQPSLAKAHYYLSLTCTRLGDKVTAAREADRAAQLEREEKNQRRVVLRLLENGPDIHPPQNAAPEKP